MTLIIENASKEFLPLFEEIAKISKTKIAIEQDEHSDKITKAIKEFEKERKSGKTKRYKSIEEFQRAMRKIKQNKKPLTLKLKPQIKGEPCILR